MLSFIVFIVAIIFVMDILQTKDALRRNFPILAWFRYGFLGLGTFLRPYLFATDHEELPFSRAKRQWVYQSTRGQDNITSFGSTKASTLPGNILFANSPVPVTKEEALPTPKLIIGPHCPTPYEPQSVFNISGMSFGTLSKPAVTALSNGAKLAGCWINTGEGGISEYHKNSGADLIVQIGTGAHSMRSPNGQICEKSLKEAAALDQVKMFEVKLSQGGKPGKGSTLPQEKLTAEIAQIMGVELGQDTETPNRHPEIGSLDELLDFINRLRQLTNKPVGFKTVLGDYDWIETLCQKILGRGLQHAPDFITLDSGDGGTGAAPITLVDHVGLPITETLPILCDTLSKYGLKNRIKVIASGKLITPPDVAWAIGSGADYVTSARGFMLAMGCIQAFKCHKNTCPTGITTHNPRLQKGLNPEDKAVKIAHYHRNIIQDLEMIAHSCGVPHPRLIERKHIRIIQNDGSSISMDAMYPAPEGLRNVA